MVDAGSTSELPKSTGQGEAKNIGVVSDAEKLTLLKKAVNNLYGEKKPAPFKSKGPKLAGLKEIAKWRESDEVKNMGEGATLRQGLEADKARKEKEKKEVEPEKKDIDENPTPEPAPVKPEKDKEPEEPEEPETPPEVIIPPPLKTDFGIGVVSDPTRIEQEIGGLAQHDRSREKPAKNTGLLGTLKGLASPIITPRVFIRNFVQNILFKGSFNARSMGFSRSMMEIARTQHANLDSSIPFEMPQEILDQAIEEGRKIRKADNKLKRFGWTLADTVSGLTGFFENSDMRYAENWFKENGKELIDAAKRTSLAEQTELGQRFALKGDNQDVISNQVGETRFKIDDVISDQPIRDALQLKIKELVASYAQNKINDEELLKQFNVYYHKEVLPKVTADKQKEITGTKLITDSMELSSNILRIAQEMKVEDRVAVGENKSRYQRYQDEKNDEGEKMWDALHFDIYLGKGKYEVARGEVRLSGLEKKLVHSMVERDYKISNDLISSSALEMLKDVGIYGGAYLLGSRGLGMLIARQSVPGLGVAAMVGIMAGREGLLVSKKGKLYGLRGRAVSDFEQVTRETAAGRKSMDKAKLRPMFEKAMVDQKKATELSEVIVSLLQKDSLSEPEQKQLLQALAHAKARLTMTDLSTKKGKALFDAVGEISVAQNFIGYSVDNNNAEMTALRATIIQGGAKLAAANPELYGKINDCQAVYEVQLKVGSFQDKVITALAKDLKITQDEARTRFADYYEGLGIDNKDRKSLEAAAFTLAKLVDRKAVTTAAFAAVVSPIIGIEMKYGGEIIGEAGRGLHELFTNHGGEWVDNWRQVITNGTIPLTYDDNHNLTSGLSPLQKDVLAIENFKLSPGSEHPETIDGVQVVLPGGVEHGYIQGHPDEDALVDVRTGEVLVHMDRSHLSYEDLNSDGKLEMVVKNDDTGQSIDAATAFSKFKGINLIQDPSLDKTTTSTPEIFHPGTQTEQTLTIGNESVAVKLPDNTHWQFDNTSGKWDLHAKNIDGSDRVLINDATINSNGQITGGSYDHSLITINNGSPVSGGAGPEISVGSTSGKEIWGSAADYRVVHAYGETYHPISNETFSTGNSDHPYGVRFVFPENTVHNPNTGATESLANAAQDNRVGLFLQIPHFGQNGEDVGVFVPAHFDTKLNEYVVNFDPTDKATTIELHNGSHISMADLSQNFLNEEKLSEHISRQGGSGILGSETWYEGRQFFNLANPDGDIAHQGRILGGYFDEGSKLYGHEAPPGQEQGAFIAIHAVHGSGAVNLVEGPPPEVPAPPSETYSPIISVGDISEETKITTLGYRLEALPTDIRIVLPLIPIPIRENIEKSVSGEMATPITTAQSTIPTTQPPTPKEKESRDILEKIAEPEKAELEEKLETKREELKALDQVIKGHLSEDEEGDKKAKEALENEIAELEARLITPEAEVQLHNYYEKFLELKKTDEIESSSTFPTANKFLWQEVVYGPERQRSSENCYRGYLMIEPKDFPKALEILTSIGTKRKSQGKRLDFKWLLMTIPSGITTEKWVEYIQNKGNFGNYDGLELTNPRIVIYGDDVDEVKEILSALAENPDWEEIEKNRVEAAGGQSENAPRRPGTNAYLFQEKEWRSLNWNNKVGYSEGEAADPDWREEKMGDKTIYIH